MVFASYRVAEVECVDDPKAIHAESLTGPGGRGLTLQRSGEEP